MIRLCRRSLVLGSLACVMPSRGWAVDRNLQLPDVLVVTGIFRVRDPSRLLGSFRFETLTALDEPLFDTSGAFEFASFLQPDRRDRTIRIPNMRVRSDGSIRLRMKRDDTIYEAVCGMGPIARGTASFLIEPIVRRTEQTVTTLTRSRTSQALVVQLWDVRVTPLPGEQ